MNRAGHRPAVPEDQPTASGLTLSKTLRTTLLSHDDPGSEMDLIRNEDTPLYRQLADELTRRIATGQLRPGASLPSLREAQRIWGVHLHTIRRAYLDLRAAGLVEMDRGGTAVAVRATGQSHDTFASAVARFLADVRDRFDADAAAVIEEVERQQRRPAPVTVVECSRTLATSIARQLATVWYVEPSIAVLTDRLAPESPVVTSCFHLRDLGNAAEAAIRLRLSPSFLARLATRLRTTPCRYIVICETDAAFARWLSRELCDALGPVSRVVTRTPHDVNRFLDQAGKDGLKLISPRHWDSLNASSRRAEDVLALEYEVHPDDLNSVGARFGWRLLSAARRI